MAGAPRTPAQGALAAVWSHGSDAALSHRSATAWWEVPGFALAPFDVIRLRDTTSCGGSSRHESRRLDDDHVVVHRGIPVTTPARTLFDLASCCHPARVERALDTMWARGLVDAAALTDIVRDLAGRGRRGSSVMRALLAARDVEYRAPESGLERRFIEIVERGGDEPFERQVQLGDSEGPIGRVDFFDRGRQLVVETDSDRYHSSPSDRANDARRDARLRRMGIEVLRIDESTLASPRQVLGLVRAARSSRDLRRAG